MSHTDESYFGYRCHEVVRLAPMDRTAEDIKALRSYMQGLDSFSLYSPKMQIALCRVVRFEQFGPGRVIVRSVYFRFTSSL